MLLLREVTVKMLYYRLLTAVFIFLGVYFTLKFVNNGREIKPNKWRKVSNASINVRKELLAGKKVSRLEKMKADAEDTLRTSNAKLTWAGS